MVLGLEKRLNYNDPTNGNPFLLTCAGLSVWGMTLVASWVWVVFLRHYEGDYVLHRVYQQMAFAEVWMGIAVSTIVFGLYPKRRTQPHNKAVKALMVVMAQAVMWYILCVAMATIQPLFMSLGDWWVLLPRWLLSLCALGAYGMILVSAVTNQI